MLNPNATNILSTLGRDRAAGMARPYAFARTDERPASRGKIGPDGVDFSPPPVSTC